MDKRKNVLQEKTLEQKENEQRIPQRLVQVRFADDFGGLELSYFSDLPEIKVGDLVTVEGKMSDNVALVTGVLKSFKKPKFDMQWIDSIIDTNVEGEYFKIDNDVVSFCHSLTVEKFLSVCAGIRYKENTAIGDETLAIELDDLEKSELFENEWIKLKGHALYKGEAIPYIYVKDGAGKAVVRGSEWYEIDFRCKDGKIAYLACDCPYFGECKHLYAFLLKLRDIYKRLHKTYQTDDFVLCKKECFHHIMTYGRGKVTIEL